MIDVIIIGAGYGGMSAAALLANAGKRVLVLDAASVIGGRAHTFRDDEGFMWEYGAHSHRLREKGIANEVFKRLGEEIEFIPESGDAKLIFKDQLWDRPEGPLRFLTTPMLSFTARITFIRLMLKLKKAEAAKWYDKTLIDFYHTWFSNVEVEQFLSFIGMTIMCPDPYKVSAGEVIDFMQRFFAARIGVGEPVGGSAQLFGKLKKFVEKNGEIHLDEKVTEILHENGQIKGVATQLSNYQATKVIFAARLPLLFEVADKKMFPENIVSYSNSIENSSGLSIDFVTDRPVTDIKGSLLGVDIPIWAKFQSNSDNSFTPAGTFLSTWGIMLPWGFNGEQAIVDQTENRLKRLITKLFPDILSHLVKERKLVVPVMNANVLTPRQSKPHRPSVTSETLSGLFFVGDTVQGDGCSGDISFSSAMKAVDIILG